VGGLLKTEGDSKTRVSLLLALRSGESDHAWALFCGRYGPRINDWCRRWGATPEDAEEVVQETLLVVFRKMAEFQYDPGQSFRAWLKSVTERVCLQVAEQARRHRQPPFPLVEMRPDLVPGDPSRTAAGEYNAILDQLADRELMDLATQNIRGRVSELMWACYERVDKGNGCREEVARSLGISAGALRVNLTRVRKLIRDELERLDPV
jgi:RNA polymerase sigma factor (sigma-70 family)